MKRVVISQPMFFPWIGIFEQLRLADLFVHYDDVQFPQGRSLMSRVQIKTYNGIQWLTVPVVRKNNQLVKDVLLDDAQDWRSKHLKTLQSNYAKARFADQMLGLAQEIYQLKTKYLSEFNIFAIEKIAAFFGYTPEFTTSSKFETESNSSEKLFDLMQLVEGRIYITGHGARNYLNHELFENNGITVEYMDYRRNPYPQLHGIFDPHVSILDLIANAGPDAVEYINSPTKHWSDFITQN